MERSRIAVRWCGGCNPRYDRAAALAAVQERYPGLLFQTFEEGGQYRGVMVICGCPAQCARQRDLPSDIPRFVICAPEGFEAAFPFLDQLSE